MTSVTKRKQLVNQLRKAHFPFGFDSNGKSNISQYIHKYPGYQVNNEAFNKNDPRKNNFSIGSQYQPLNPNAYLSQFKEKYPQHPGHTKQQLIGANNVGVNNIIFGYQKSQDQKDKYNTNYKDQYNKKNANQQRNKPIDNRKKNIQFGDSLTDFTTTYANVYDKKNITGNIPFIDRAEIRKSNLMLAYRNVTTQNYHAVKPKLQANIDLGSDSINYSSQNKQNFNYKDAPRQVVQKQMIRDFRSAHFQFGFPQEKNNVQSEAKAQYTQKPLQAYHVEGRRPNNINLNLDGNAYYQSSYGKDYADWGTQQRPQKINKDGRNGNILIGTDCDPADRYISQAKQNFVKKQINRAQPIKALAELRLGQQQGDYRTHNQLTYDNKFPFHQTNKVTQDDINKMKQLNICTGFQQGSYNLHSSQYGKKLGQRGTLSKDTLAKMKNTNIVLETVVNTNQLKGKTTYTTAHYYKRNQEF